METETKIYIGVVILFAFVIWFQQCHFFSKVESLQQQVQTVECVKKCLQDLK